MVGHAAAAVLAIGVTLSGTALDMDTVPRYEDLGYCRITTYCPSCNDGAGHESSSGIYLEAGRHVACRWLPNGTVINIEGDEYTVVDTCGTDAIDIFVDTDTCHCSLNEYKHVSIKRR